MAMVDKAEVSAAVDLPLAATVVEWLVVLLVIVLVLLRNWLLSVVIVLSGPLCIT